ncbi:hypothetical protein [Halosegnis longus]|uniref:hypothetical protein n=1 Tax=Halosegnis longus TaxID=2216012 RepID=UPI00129E9403|nr:hypothetical protein [Halosegnis longus]
MSNSPRTLMESDDTETRAADDFEVGEVCAIEGETGMWLASGVATDDGRVMLRQEKPNRNDFIRVKPSRIKPVQTEADDPVSDREFGELMDLASTRHAVKVTFWVSEEQAYGVGWLKSAHERTLGAERHVVVTDMRGDDATMERRVTRSDCTAFAMAVSDDE